MLVYRTPTVTAYRKRKLFHATQKEQAETISDWFKRLQQSITDCEYDLMAEYILIDKFVSGLDEMDFQKIAQVASWTLEDLILTVIGNTHIFSKFPVKDIQPQEIAILNVKSETVNSENSVKFSKISTYFLFVFTGTTMQRYREWCKC